MTSVAPKKGMDWLLCCGWQLKLPRSTTNLKRFGDKIKLIRCFKISVSVAMPCLAAFLKFQDVFMAPPLSEEMPDSDRMPEMLSECTQDKITENSPEKTPCYFLLALLC